MNKILTLAVVTVALILGSSACSSGQNTITEPTTSGTKSASTASEEGTATMGYKKISAEEAKVMIDAGNVIILDVRTQDEYDAGHISGAIRLESADFEAKAVTVLPDKDATILVYCRSGNRSKTASGMLIDLGYTAIYDFGGIIDWPYETVTK